MTQSSKNQEKKTTADWLVHGILTKLGDSFDKLTGRRWKPSSSLATSELIERMKALVDSEIRESPEGRRYVPHNIKLKMQWDKFATDSDEGLKKLEYELMASLIDHINDRRYLTYSPISLIVKPDYFTSGVKLFASFDNVEEEREVSMNVTVPSFSVEVPSDVPKTTEPADEFSLSITYSAGGKDVQRIVDLTTGDRLSVGRTGDNDVPIDDISVSKMHASLLVSQDGQLVVADTGSTNGTFVGGQRISYGKAIPVVDGQDLRFGTIDVKFVFTRNQAPKAKPEPEIADENGSEEVIVVGDMQFKAKQRSAEDEEISSLPTEPAIGHSVILQPLTAETTEFGPRPEEEK